MDVRIKNILIDQMQEARKTQAVADEALTLVYDTINKLYENVDLTKVPTCAENAENLEEAINCFVSYNEYTIEDLIEEIENVQKMIDDGYLDLTK